jgi:hypothetical protein
MHYDYPGQGATTPDQGRKDQDEFDDIDTCHPRRDACRPGIRAGRNCRSRPAKARSPGTASPNSRRRMTTADSRSPSPRPGLARMPRPACLSCAISRGHRRYRARQRLGRLRAADRHRCRGRLAPEHRRFPPTGPDVRSRAPGATGRSGLGDRGLDDRELCRRTFLDRTGKLRRPGGVLRLFLQREREVAGLVQPGEFRGSGL